QRLRDRGRQRVAPTLGYPPSWDIPRTVSHSRSARPSGSENWFHTCALTASHSSDTVGRRVRIETCPARLVPASSHEDVNLVPCTRPARGRAGSCGRPHL